MKTLTEEDLKITTIRDELKWHIDSYKYCAEEKLHYGYSLTNYQINTWPPAKGLNLNQLGLEHENPLSLPLDSGVNRQTIFNSKFKGVVEKYTQDSNKRSPSPGGLTRFGLWFHHNLFQVLVLLLKNEWEKYFATKAWIIILKFEPDLPETETASLLSCLKGYESTLKAENFNIRFSRELGDNVISEWATCLNEEGILDKYNVTVDQLKTLINDMVDSFLFLRHTWSSQVMAFSEKQFKLLGVLSEQELNYKEAYWIKKGSYQVLEMNIGEILYQIETLKIDHLRIENEWFKLFGENHINILSLQLEESLLEDRRTLENAQNHTKEEIDQIIEEKKARKIGEFEELKEKMDDQAWISFIENGNATTLQGDEQHEYQKQCKSILSQIFKLTHPDKSRHYPFTSKQRDFLKDWFEEAMTIKKRDPDYILGTIQLSRLRRILSGVQALYACLGENIEIDKELEDSSIKDQIDIYERRILQLEKELNIFQNNLDGLQRNRDIAEKNSQISSPDVIAQYKKAQEERIAELKQKIEILENQET